MLLFSLLTKSTYCTFKGVIGCKINFYKLFELKCLLAVCVHNHPIMIKIHPVFFFLNHNPFLRSSYSQILVSVTLHRPSLLPRLLIDSGVLSQTRPEWAFISPPLFRHQSRCRQVCLLSNWGVLLDVIMNIAVVIYSRYLRCWRRSGLLLFLKGMCPDLPKCAYVYANYLWSEEVSVRYLFYEFLQIACPNNVQVSKFHNECG